MNRKYQLEKTLIDNLNNLSDCSEIVMVDYGSIDGLKDYIYKNFSKYIINKKLRYYYTDKVKYWHASICKNTTHMLADGRYVVNLDCDNFIGNDSDKLLLDLFEKNGDDIIITQSDYVMGSGNGGRITISKNNFKKLGGYDETFYPMGYQDYDLIERAKLFGFKFIHLNKNNKCIKNTKEESIYNIGINISYDKMNCMNKLLSKINIENNNLIVNRIKGIGINFVF
jgi:predicted glycosyltransferase involved in capsule biosynthesis